MKWPLVSRPLPNAEIPLYNRYYLHAPKASHVDPVIVMGTEFEADALLAFLQQKNRAGGTILTTAHALIRATGLALARYPEMNARVVGRSIRHFRDIGIRMAFFHRNAKEIDLMLIDGVDRKSIEEIAAEVWRRLLEAARGNGGRDRDLARMRKVPAFWFRQMMRFYGFLDRHFHLPAVSRLDELRGGSAMVNDLSHAGMPPLRSYKPSRFADGSDSINLTLGPVETRLVLREGKPVEVRVMPLFMRADHRLTDAYQIGRFLATVRETLQNPERLQLLRT
ncbi:Branched-chain alpha-keto acid dehydrogenase subunit E2 OS=Afipia felis OX=1035 GN=BN961_00707 PE=4 SV=1 [Afipia felis]